MSTEKMEPVAWRTFDGEDGYDYRDFDENEDYAEAWAKRNPFHKDWVDAIYTASQLQAAVAAERERCAKVCWKLAGEYAIGIDETGDRAHGKMVAANSCAAAIRQLGDEQ